MSSKETNTYRVGVDAREFARGAHTGLRTIMKDLLDNMPYHPNVEVVLFCDNTTETEILPGNSRIVMIPDAPGFVQDQFLLPALIRREEVDSFFTPYVKIPLIRVCPYVNMICDIIPLVRSRYKGFHGILDKMYFFAQAFLSGRRSARVITLSRDAAEKAHGILRVPPEKIEVVYPAVDGGIAPVKASPPLDGEDYMLYLGNFHPHKNVERLIEAYSLLPGKVRDSYGLVLAGGREEELERILKKISDLGVSRTVRVLPSQDHEKAMELLRSSRAFVFPSIQEGFGIPPLEAMALGVPVAVSAVAPMTEVLGDAALYFDPRDVRDMADVMEKILFDGKKRKELSARGKERAGRFTAGRMAGHIIDVILSVSISRTLCVSSEFPPMKGGIATHIFNLWSRLPCEKIIVLTARPPGRRDMIDEGMTVHRKRYPLGGDIVSRVVRTLAVIWFVWRENCYFHVDRNHCAQVLSAGLAGLLVKKFRKTPYVVYTYSADILEFGSIPYLERILVNVLYGAEHIIANSEFTRGLILDRCPAVADKIEVSTPAVDAGVFLPGKGGEVIRQRYGIPAGANVLLTVSRLAERKGHEAVIRSLEGILTEFPDTFYLVAGEGRELDRLKALAAEKGLGENVIFTGEVGFSELVDIYNACDVFVMVPRHIEGKGDVEGFGIVFLEANACGKPVVAGDSGGVSEAVEDMRSGILVDPDSVRSIREGILRLLRDKDLAADLGRKGRERVIREFAWQSRADRLREFI